jgi:hypothetical protein
MTGKHATVSRAFSDALNNRRQRDAASVLSAMQRGQHLSVWFDGWHGARWKLSGGRRVADDVARLVVASEHVVSVGDALFEGLTPQTYRYAEA